MEQVLERISVRSEGVSENEGSVGEGRRIAAEQVLSVLFNFMLQVS